MPEVEQCKEQLPGAVVDDAGLRFDSLPPLSLYVHLPWCVRKCPYCDFNSYEARGALPDLEYVDALLRDLRGELPLAQGRPRRDDLPRRRHAEPVLGRGDRALARRRAHVGGAGAGCRDHARGESRAPSTPRASPRFARPASIGCRSAFRAFATSSCARSAACTTSSEAQAAVATARAAGFDNLNLDFMYGLPDDDVAGAVADLERAIALAPTHLSWYQLTLEPNTAFERRPPPLPDDDVVARIEEQGRALLAAHGYERYEISAYAQRGRRCLHNLNYWQFGDYLGIGAGAHGKVTLPADGRDRAPRQDTQPAHLPAARRRRRGDERGARRDARAGGARVPDERAAIARRNARRDVRGARRATRRGDRPRRARRPSRAAGSAPSPSGLRATPAGLERLNRLLELFA